MRQEFLKSKDLDPIYRSPKTPAQAILHAKFNFNTTRLTLTDLEGNTIIWLTPSRCGFKGTVRRTVFASKSTITQMAKQMVELDILHVHVRLKGITRAARRQFLRLIRAEGVYVTSIEDVTPIPFNGTRLRSKRRR